MSQSTKGTATEGQVREKVLLLVRKRVAQHVASCRSRLCATLCVTVARFNNLSADCWASGAPAPGATNDWTDEVVCG